MSLLPSPLLCVVFSATLFCVRSALSLHLRPVQLSSPSDPGATAPQGDVRIVIYDHDDGDDAASPGCGLRRLYRAPVGSTGHDIDDDGGGTAAGGGHGESLDGREAGVPGLGDAVCCFLWVHTGFVRDAALRLKKVGRAGAKLCGS